MSQQAAHDNPSGVPAAQPKQVVQYLLAHNYLLTALELLVEAQEAGNEEDVDSLQHFFSDQAKFPAEVVAKYDPNDAINVQQLARKREERLGVLEYELRVAKEDLAETKASYKKSTSSAMSTASAARLDASGTMQTPAEANGSIARLGTTNNSTAAESDSLSQSEVVLLNAAVRSYLVTQGYKLTALTLSEEGGSNIPAALPQDAASLVDLFQGHAEKVAAAEARQEAEVKQQQANEQAAAADATSASLQEALDAMTKEKARLRADMEFLQRQLDLVAQQANQVQADTETHPAGKASQAADEGMLQSGDNVGPTLLGAEAALRVVAEQLPKIVPNMLINKRDEVLPVFLAVIQEHRDAATRDKLTHALFNLVKKPNTAQRRLIADSCADLAARIGPSRTAEELLPQCWEQVNHRHAERRALVAEACGALAPYVASEMRPSLILSILQQMSTDTDAIVRRAVVHSLTHLLPLLPDLDKFQAVQNLLLQLAKDPSQDVVDASFEHLLPGVLKWMADIRLLHTSLLPAVLSEIRALIERCPFLAGTSEELLQEGQAEMRAVNDHQQRQVQVLLRLYTSLLPHLRHAALQARPSWAGEPTLPDDSTPDGAHDALHATIKREAAAVLNIGHTLHSEDEEVSPATNAPASTQMFSPDSPRSSAPDTSTRLSTAQSMAEDDEDISAPQAAPASTTSSLTQGNLEVIAASNGRTHLPSASVSSQAGSVSTVTQQQKDAQGHSYPGMTKPAASPSVQAVTQHPLQSPTHLPPDAQSAEAANLPQASPEEVAPDSQQDEIRAQQVQEPNASLPSVGQHASTSTSAADAAFAAWLSAADHAEWAVVEYLASQALPLLIKALRMVAPQTETEAVRRRFSAAVKATCLSVGPEMTKGLIQPVFAASAALPDADESNHHTPEHVMKLVDELRCTSTEARRVGRVTVLPILLSGVLPYGQLDGKLLEDLLLGLMQDSKKADKDAVEDIWAVQHLEEMIAAVHFAAAFQEVQGPVARVMKTLQPQHNPDVRRCAVACACALAPCLPRHQVIRQVLPVLQSLSEDSDSAVQAAAIEGLAQLLPLHGGNPELAGRLYSHLDDLVTNNQPQVQLLVLRSLTIHVAQFGEPAMEFLLQKVLMVLTYVHRRGPASVPAQLQDLAHACFVALRAADTCEVQNETVQLHLVAALQSLHREGELLPATQRDVLSAMLREHGASAILQTGDAQTPQHRRSFTGSSEGTVAGGHLMASNQASPGIPRQPSNLTRRPSDLGQPISGGQQTPNKGNLGAALLRRFNSGATQEPPRRSIFRSGSATMPTPQDQHTQAGNSNKR
ncbi:hypothetical protein WJX82_008236 [Trebouxia sp. C0006]